MIDRIDIGFEPHSFPSSFTVEIFEGTPGSLILGESQTVTMTAAPEETNMFYVFGFSSPIPVSKGTQYSWKLVCQESSDCGISVKQCRGEPDNGHGYSSTKEFPDVDFPFKLAV